MLFRSKIHFNFYETLFEEQSLKQLHSYLEIPYHDLNTTEKVFSFGDHPLFTDEQKLKLFNSYLYAKENYDFAVEWFGKDFIETIWWNPYK